ncbi:MAG: GAF domain-containing protein, partial [Deltaproteobacteria bacterium]|nr:GAF domain-containing protein [Deltaproteobacteria bacterium]
DACQEGAFKDNPEVQEMQLRSVFCLPAVKQSKMIGILYLENRLSGSVFTAEKTKMTELLASQAAISLENATLLRKHQQAEEALRERENELRKSLAEKEVLLKEIHHRVKNNLQIVQSVLNLQLPYLKDEQAIELFKESQNRVYSMALVHEKLYQSESLARIDLAEYIQSLTANLFLSYGVSGRVVKPIIDVENLTLDVSVVIPCALIVNELVSNSLKHAFPDSFRRAGGTAEIRIALRRDACGEITLNVSDNGVGLPAGFTTQGSASLGLRIVNVLVRQLRGTIHHGKSGVAQFTITFAPRVG